MGPLHDWIWERPDWPDFRWDVERLAEVLARARLAQGKALGAGRLLDFHLTLEAAAAILVEDGLTTSAIEGERFAPDVVRSSVARHLGLPTAGLPEPPHAPATSQLHQLAAQGGQSVQGGKAVERRHQLAHALTRTPAAASSSRSATAS